MLSAIGDFWKSPGCGVAGARASSQIMSNSASAQQCEVKSYSQVMIPSDESMDLDKLGQTRYHGSLSWAG
jgi:hypothetical protein